MKTMKLFLLLKKMKISQAFNCHSNEYKDFLLYKVDEISIIFNTNYII
jgi:hypothetical protein